MMIYVWDQSHNERPVGVSHYWMRIYTGQCYSVYIKGIQCWRIYSNNRILEMGKEFSAGSGGSMTKGESSVEGFTHGIQC